MLLSRSGLALATLATLSLWSLGPEADEYAAAATASDFPHAALGIASLVQLAASGWVILVIALTRVSGTSRLVRAITPEVLRRTLLVGAASALAIAPASAERGSPNTQVAADRHSLDGLTLPDRPVAVTTPVDRVIVVRPGDTLWAIAARSLPAGTSEAEIADSCAQWYAANRAVIGDDPDLIHPSQRLTPPAKDSA